MFHFAFSQASIFLVLQKVIDIPESDIVKLLRLVVDAHRSRNPQSGSVPQLSQLLATSVSYRCTANSLRLAIREHFTDAEGLTCLLEILSHWLDEWSNKDVNLGLGEMSLSIHAEGHVVAKANRKMRSKMRKQAEELPDLEAVSFNST